MFSTIFIEISQKNDKTKRNIKNFAVRISELKVSGLASVRISE
jgi:hypothetical protein